MDQPFFDEVDPNEPDAVVEVELWYMCKLCLKYYSTFEQYVVHRRSQHRGMGREKKISKKLKQRCIQDRDTKTQRIVVKKLEDITNGTDSAALKAIQTSKTAMNSTTASFQ